MNGYEILGRFIVAAIFYVFVTVFIGALLALLASPVVNLGTAFPYCVHIAGCILFSGLWAISDE